MQKKKPKNPQPNLFSILDNGDIKAINNPISFVFCSFIKAFVGVYFQKLISIGIDTPSFAKL